MNATEILSRVDLLTDCERSMRYHQARARFLNTVHLCIQFAVFALTTTSAAFLIQSLLSEWVGFGLLAAVSLLALLSLVWNPADKANLHKSLHRDFTILTSAIYSNARPDEAALAGWTRDIHALYAQEPPVFRALHAHCANQLAIALNADRGCFVDLKFHQRLLRNWLPFQGGEFLNRNQARQ